MEAKPGEVIWIELYMKDPEKAKPFYASLLGWDVQDVPMGPDFHYTMFNRNGLPAGGAFPLTPEMAGMPPAWMIYIRVDDITAKTAQAKELGAAIVEGPSEIPNVGHMTLLKDPAGAHLCLFQPGQHRGIGAWAEDHTVCWIEHQSSAQAAAMDFYSKLFGWTYEAGHEGYQHIVGPSGQLGGMVSGSEAPPHWGLYFRSPDCEATAEKAKSGGGSIAMGPMEIPGGSRIALLTDPQGAAFGIYSDPR